jgi:integrase
VGEVHQIRAAYPAPTFAHAVESFLVAHTAGGAWAAGTATKYRQTLTVLAARLAGGPVGHDLAVLDTAAGAARLLAAFTAAFGTTAAATQVRHLSTLRSAIGWWRDPAGWLRTDPTAGWVRPKVVVDTTRALTRDQVAALWRLPVGLRDKTLWRLLYETAARAEEILTLDVPDLDLGSKRARVISKGGNTEWVFWQTGAAMLLPRLLAGRRPIRPLADSADQAQGWTLHQLRHPAHPRGRERHQYRHPAGPLPSRLGPVAGTLRPSRPGSRRRARRGERPGRASTPPIKPATSHRHRGVLPRVPRRAAGLRTRGRHRRRSRLVLEYSGYGTRSVAPSDRHTLGHHSHGGVLGLRPCREDHGAVEPSPRRAARGWDPSRNRCPRLTAWPR